MFASLASIAIVLVLASHAGSGVTVLVDESTLGYYNASIGTTLDGTGPQFPLANLGNGDPTIVPASEPDLSLANGTLGSWLSPSPLPLGSAWSALQPIPAEWPINDETAIIYPIDAGTGGVSQLVGDFGVDNGLFVWVNGVFKFGALEPGFANVFEYPDVDLGSLPPGVSYIHVLREDHGQGTGFAIRVRTADEIGNRNPTCGAAAASATMLPLVRKRFAEVSIAGVTDPDGDDVTTTVIGVTQDEPLEGPGFGNRCPDAIIAEGSATVELRGERGTRRSVRNGRVYHVSFTAEDGHGGSCVGQVAVCVPRSSKAASCVDDPARFDSTGPCN